MRRAGARAAVLALAGAMVLGAAPALAQERWVEAAGVARAEPGEGKGGPGQQAALRAALREAVQQVAVELLTEAQTKKGGDAPDAAALAARASSALGADPMAYVTRYQIREDRGVRPRLLLADPEAKAEYQLVIMAQVDVGKIRRKVGAGVAPGPEEEEDAEEPAGGYEAAAAPAQSGESMGGISSFDVEIDRLATWSDYQAVRDALHDPIGARVEPVEFTRGRAVFSVASPVPPAELAAALSRALAGRVRIEPVQTGEAPEGDRVRLRVAPPEGAQPPPRN